MLVRVGFVMALLAMSGGLAVPASAQVTDRLERGTRAFAGGVADLGRDAWAVAGSPWGMSWSHAPALGVVMGGGLLLFTLDEELSERLVEPDPGAYGRFGAWLEPVGLQGKTNVYFAGAAALGYLSGIDGVKEPAKEILYSQWIAGLIRQGIGAAAGRRRPNEGLGAYTFEPGGGTAFPSGHSSSIVVVASVLSHHIDRWPVSVALYGAAGAVLLERIQSDAHWTSDVWFGAILGGAVSRAVMAAEQDRRLSVHPVRSPDGSGYGVGVSIIF